MGKSLKLNFIYSNLLTVSSFIFPLVSFPYVSRVLGPSGVGIYNYAYSLTIYFILFASLGLPVYGVREIAKAKTNKKDLANTFSELLLINLVSTVLLAVSSFFILKEIDIMAREYYIRILTVIFILTNVGNIDWFFRGLEDYKFITFRTILIRIFTIILLFLVVKDQNDYYIYYFLTVLSNLCISLFNIHQALKITRISFKGINLKRHLTPLLTLFSTQLAISVYINLDTVMLGSLSTIEQVGYYAASIKVVKICLTVITSLGVVLIPRLSLFIKEANHDKVKELTNKSLSFIMMLGIPLSLGLALISDPLINLFAGSEFNESIKLIYLLSPIIVVIGLSNLFGMQILVPSGKEKYVLISVIIGAIINLTLNFVLIPLYKSEGAAVATLVAEIAVTFATGYFATKFIKLSISFKRIAFYFLLSLTFVPIYFTSVNLFQSPVCILLVTISGCSLSYVLGLYLVREEIIINNMNLRKYLAK